MILSGDLRKVTVGLTALSLRRVLIVLEDCDLDVGLITLLQAALKARLSVRQIIFYMI